MMWIECWSKRISVGFAHSFTSTNEHEKLFENCALCKTNLMHDLISMYQRTILWERIVCCRFAFCEYDRSLCVLQHTVPLNFPKSNACDQCALGASLHFSSMPGFHFTFCSPYSTSLFQAQTQTQAQRRTCTWSRELNGKSVNSFIFHAKQISNNSTQCRNRWWKGQGKKMCVNRLRRYIYIWRRN